MFGAELTFKEPSKALYALANASCFQSGTFRSFLFSRRSSTWEKMERMEWRDTVSGGGKSISLFFCSVCCFLVAFSHSTSFSFLGAFNAHEFVFPKRKESMRHFSYRLVFSAVSSLSFHFCIQLPMQVDLHAERKSQNFYVDILLCLSIVRLHMRDDCAWSGLFNKIIIGNS